MSPRLKATILSTRTDFDAACDQAAELDVQIRAAEAARDRAIQAIRDEHEPLILGLKQRRDALTVISDKYAETHRAELFPSEKKSAETGLALYGFRLGNPTLKPLNKKWNWESILAAVKTAFPGRFVRTVEEIDKDALKAQLNEAQLATVGCKIAQGEAFYIEPKEQPSEQAA